MPQQKSGFDPIEKPYRKNAQFRIIWNIIAETVEFNSIITYYFDIH